MKARKFLLKLLGLFICCLMIGCNVIKNTASDDFKDGTYNAKMFQSRKVYVQNNDDSLIVYKLNKINGEYVADTAFPFKKSFANRINEALPNQSFNALTFDFDALTIPFKYRSAQKNLPQQFTTSLNGAVYLGFRNDVYKLKYKKQFFNYYEKTVSHYAISFGGFTGLGSTAMNQWVTNYNINSEYEGVVWSKGAAVIMAVGKFTSGVSIGWDNLLDKNKKFWIYEGKPWIGLVFGLNLN